MFILDRKVFNRRDYPDYLKQVWDFEGNMSEIAAIILSKAIDIEHDCGI